MGLTTSEKALPQIAASHISSTARLIPMAKIAVNERKSKTVGSMKTSVVISLSSPRQRCITFYWTKINKAAAIEGLQTHFEFKQESLVSSGNGASSRSVFIKRSECSSRENKFTIRIQHQAPGLWYGHQLL